MKIQGGCHCGYITYEAEIDPEKVSICHCTDRQSGSGSAYRTYGLRVGSIRQRAELRPRSMGWCRSAQPWSMDLSALPRFEKQRG